MRLHSLRAIILIAIGLTGCATAAQRQVAAISSTMRQAGTELQECLAEKYHKPEYASIVPHLPSPENKFRATMSQLADDTIPTKKESKLLAQLHDDGLPCREAELEKLGSVAPALSEVVSEQMVKRDAITMQLVKRKTTWGKALQQLEQERIEFQKKFTAVAQQMDNNFQASHQAELAQRQAASDALMQWSMQQQLINSMNRPTVTTCNDTGPFINCVSNR